VSRPVDWAPLASADPVPGDPVEVALTGGRLMQVAEQISADVTWLRSLCTAQFWDSDAGRAFEGQVDNAATKLAKAHERYLTAGEALGSGLSSGYAGALEQAQALSLQALSQGQQAWSMMRTQLAAVEVAGKGFVPYESAPLTLSPGLPMLDSSGNPALMITPAGGGAELRAAVSRYNASALEYRTANGWLAEAIAMRDEAAARAAAAIRAALGADGLQDQTGGWHDFFSAIDGAFGFAEQHWAQVVGDIATVCSWIASVLGVLALIFAFICPALAAVLEGLALTLTEVATICDLVLAIFGKGSWMAVGIDLLSLATFGWGRSLLRAGKATVEAADDIGLEGVTARAGVLSAGLESAEHSVGNIGSVVAKAAAADDETVAAKGLLTRLPGFLGDLSEKAALKDFTPENPLTDLKTIRETDWSNVLGKNPVKTIRAAVGQAAHLKNPEFADALKELEEIPDIERITKLSGINFPNAITHYNKIWVGSQVAALGTDALDKLDLVLNHYHIDIPGYDWLKEYTTT
jgi:hypothetical protein